MSKPLEGPEEPALNTAAATGPRPAGASKVARRAGWALTALPTLFLLFDGLAKVLMLEPVREACAQLEIPERVVPGLGAVLMAATLIYAFPRTAALGAVLLTGYLGGAIWTHVRVGDPPFTVVFPVLVASLIWGGLLLREPRLLALFPVRRSAPAGPVEP